jgi:hypothetical protein
MYRLKMLRDRVVQNADRLIQSPEFQKAAAWAADTAARVKSNLEEARKVFLEQLDGETEDDLKHLKRKLKDMEKNQQLADDHKGKSDPT